ncbi:MAG: DEAD/DEAH box helicase [Phycisphaeraceae bacterium]|nr:DEAD/DEAH box helicase [Phycisphaeraceae bacterium]
MTPDPDTNLFGAPNQPADPHAAPPDARHFVRVAVERGIDAPTTSRRAKPGTAAHAPANDSTLTYAADEHIPVGRRVEVPLGRGSTPTGGIVVESGGRELLEGLDPARVKRILRAVSNTHDPAGSSVDLPPTLIDLARWISTYYVCPIGMTLAAMIPSAVKRATGGRTVELLRLAEPADPEAWLKRLEDNATPPTPALRRTLTALAAIEPARFPLPARQLADLLSEKTLRSVNRLIQAGILERASAFSVRATGGAPIDSDDAFNDDPIAPGDPSLLPLAPSSPPPPLTPAQSEIVHGVWSTIDAFNVHLLRGITGSGKTEVYLHLIERLLNRDAHATALVLVPEISLTPQMGGRFRARLGHHGVAILHSGLSASQRHEQWRRAALAPAEGGARVVVGARSAVFAPLRNVGLIIVDEEHASDYKQDQLPRYHGRDVAIKRAQLESCPILLGSATPSLESWLNAQPGGTGDPPVHAHAPLHSTSTSPSSSSSHASPPCLRGGAFVPSSHSSAKYRLWQLTERIALTGSPTLPTVTVVDIAEERRAMARHRRSVVKSASPLDSAVHRSSHAQEIGEMIGPTLERAIRSTITAGGQAVLLLNRRGYAGYISCADQNCGFVLTCDDCDATMVHHRRVRFDLPRDSTTTNRLIRCHHCLAQRLLPPKCPDCGKGLIWLGLGTQRVEEEVLSKFADLFDAPAAPADDPSPTRPPTDDHDADDVSDEEADQHRHVLPPLPPWLARADGDTMTSARDWFTVLGRFGRGEIRILLGTQMIAKGLDYPNVRLVGVINADTALSLPDFRAAERTFQLISQVAGRAGRGEHPGRVIVQTMEPNSPTIVLAAKHDYVGFAERELAVRARSHLPPITRMARIVVRDEDLDKAMARARTIADALRAVASSADAHRAEARSAKSSRPGASIPNREPALTVTGPLPCPIARIARQFRIAIELTAARRGVIQSALMSLRAKGLVKSDAHTAVDVDPLALL